MKKYRGSCHCGAVAFEFQSPVIGAGIRCNCSICSRRSATMSTTYFAPEDFQLSSGGAALAPYIWGDRMVKSYFCRICGIYTFHEVIDKPGHYRVNLCCVPEIDTGTLTIDLIDGRSF